MQCTRCYSPMQLIRRENHQDSYLEWHQCPTCQRLEFLSQPVHHELDLIQKATHPGSLAIEPTPS